MLADDSADLVDEAYNSLEAEARATLIALFVRPECELVFSEAVDNYAAEDHCLYLGSHACCKRDVDEPDSLYIELWAWVDEDDGSDFVTWNAANTDKWSHHPIVFCPFCGLDLHGETLNRVAQARPSDLHTRQPG